MSTDTVTPYRSGQRPGRDDFPHLLWSEWTKFRSVRGWLIAMIAATVLTAVAVVALAGTANGGQNAGATPTTAIGHWTATAASPPGSPRCTPSFRCPTARPRT